MRKHNTPDEKKAKARVEQRRKGKGENSGGRKFSEPFSCVHVRAHSNCNVVFLLSQVSHGEERMVSKKCRKCGKLWFRKHFSIRFVPEI